MLVSRQETIREAEKLPALIIHWYSVEIKLNGQVQEITQVTIINLTIAETYYCNVRARCWLISTVSPVMGFLLTQEP